MREAEREEGVCMGGGDRVHSPGGKREGSERPTVLALSPPPPSLSSSTGLKSKGMLFFLENM